MGFRCKQFYIDDSDCAMKVSTDSLLLGSWADISDNGPFKILDIGCGSGLLTLMLLQNTQGCLASGAVHIHGIEIDTAAAKQARHNLNRCDWAQRGEVFNVSLQQFTGHQYRYFICNPPYFDTPLRFSAADTCDSKRRLARLDEALDAQSLLVNCVRLAEPDFTLFMVYPHAHVASFTHLAQSHGLYLDQRCDVASQDGEGPYISLLRFSNQLQTECTLSNLVIKNQENYSEEYRTLCKDFYLRF